MGMGFPSYRGGILFWADTMGTNYVYSRLTTWCKLYGGFFKPCDYPAERAIRGLSLLPALILPEVTLVVSPLLALIVDQLKKLPPVLPGGLLSSNQTSEESLETLNRLCSGEIKSYHSGLHAKERSLVQELFCSNKIRVVVATVAFGMGLDKSDVEGVRQQNLNTPYSIASCFIGKLVGVSHHTGNLVGKLILILVRLRLLFQK